MDSHALRGDAARFPMPMPACPLLPRPTLRVGLLAAAVLAFAPLPAAHAQQRAGASGGTPSAATTIDRAARAFRAARTVRATFEQTLENPATGNRATANGELVLAQPNKVSVRFAQPSGDRIVSDGRSMWVYLPSTLPGQVVKLPARARGSMVGVDALGEMLSAPRARYDVSDAGVATIGGRATRAVTLTPKADDGPITKATVWVDDRDGAVRQLALTDPSGLVRTLRMTTWTPNARVADSTFAFRVPEGVRVVDQAALQSGGR